MKGRCANEVSIDDAFVTTAPLQLQLRRSLAAIIGVTGLAVILLVAYGPIAQPLEYHRYADARTIAGVPHFWNVVSNLPFAAIGVFGRWWITGSRPARFLAEADAKQMWMVLFAGEFLTCFGSAYYHAIPSNATLVWDRLAFSLILASFFSIAIAELVSPKTGRQMLLPMVVAGLGSVVYWAWTESRGHGDLRPYALVQFVPVILIPILALMSRGRLVPSIYFLAAWVLYGLAKVCEIQDATIYDLTGFWSGHTLKHFLAAAASALPLVALVKRVAGRLQPARTFGAEGRRATS